MIFMSGTNDIIRTYLIAQRDGADFRSPPAYATGIQVHEIGPDVIAYTTTCKLACCLAKGTRVNAGTRREAARSVERSRPNRTAATVVAKRTLTDIALT